MGLDICDTHRGFSADVTANRTNALQPIGRFAHVAKATVKRHADRVGLPTQKVSQKIMTLCNAVRIDDLNTKQEKADVRP